MDEHGRFKGWAFRFVSGTLNGQPKMFCQVWMHSVAFTVAEQGYFCEYAYKLKFKDWPDMPKDLHSALNHAYIALFSPVKKDFRKQA